MQADKIAKRTRDRIAEQSQVPEYTDEATLEAYKALLTATLAHLLAAKTQRKRDRVLLDWAMTQYNWAKTELTLFEKTAQAAHLDRAQDLLRVAAAEFSAAVGSHYVSAVAPLQAAIYAARSAR